MDAIIFCGIQGSGKTTLYKDLFFKTHVRINLDMLKTRHRESQLLGVCIQTKQPFVVDNTNPTREERARYIAPARTAGFRTTSYFFDVSPRVAIGRNRGRPREEQIPVYGILGTFKRLRPPARKRGSTSCFG